MVIGSLGVLGDTTVTQASTVDCARCSRMPPDSFAADSGAPELTLLITALSAQRGEAV